MSRRGSPLITLRALFPIAGLRVISGSVWRTSQWFLFGTSLWCAVFGKQVQQCGTIMYNWLHFAGSHREADGFKARFSSWDTFIFALSIWVCLVPFLSLQCTSSSSDCDHWLTYFFKKVYFAVKSLWIVELGILALFCLFIFQVCGASEELSW